MSKGFKITICNNEYLVKVMCANSTSTKNKNYSLNINLQVQVFDKNGLVKLDKNSYVVEKITDFISNSVNGQDTCYWDFNKPNRHLKEEEEE